MTERAQHRDEILPFLAKERVAQVRKTPKEDRAKMFEMIRMMDVKDVKITKGTKAPTGFTLEATGVIHWGQVLIFYYSQRL